MFANTGRGERKGQQETKDRNSEPYEGSGY